MSTPEELKGHQETLAKASFGMDVEAFLHTAIGKYLVTRAEEHLQAALLALKDVNAMDVKAITELQIQARVADTIQAWLAQAIQDGRNAEEQLSQLDS